MQRMRHGAGIGALVLTAAVVAGCGPKRNPGLDQARSTYETAAADPRLAEHAPIALHEAGQTLRRAEDAWDDGKKAETEHLAYLTERRVDIARADARRDEAEKALRETHAARSDVLLEAREREIAALRSRETARGTVVTIPDVLFETDRAELKPGAMRDLYQLVSQLRDHPDRSISIEGYTDATGAASYNRDLSERRAEAVEAFFVRNGIDRSRITTRGLGEAYPVASNDTEAGRQQNRRVEVVISHGGEGMRSGTSGYGAGRPAPGSTRSEGGTSSVPEPGRTTVTPPY
jgi:OOP family OmpA-OmpF porin